MPHTLKAPYYTKLAFFVSNHVMNVNIKNTPGLVFPFTYVEVFMLSLFFKYFLYLL